MDDLPVYGLPAADPRRRWTASRSDSPAWRVLAHGEAEAADRVDVGVMRRVDRVRIHPTLADQLLLGRHEPPAGDEADHRRWVEELAARARGARWTRDVLRVEGESLEAERLDEDGHWIAVVEVGDVWLYAHSRGTPIDQVELVLTAGAQTRG